MGNRRAATVVVVLAASCAASQVFVPAAAAPLLARVQCPANSSPCPTSLGAAFNDVCFQNGQTCALDANNSPACCPSEAVCTGAAPPTAPAGGPTAAVSFVPNPYFSFPYAPASVASSAACASAMQACSSNYAACVTGLQGNGGGYAVTVKVAGGGGTTVAGPRVIIGVEATSVCSSLSSAACSRLEATRCESFGQASGDPSTAHPPRPSAPALVAAAFFFFLALILGAWP